MNDEQTKKDFPAFPITAGQQVYNGGITARDWFAGMALQGLLASHANPNATHPLEIVGSNVTALEKALEHAKDAYTLADAMMEVRK